MTAPNHTALIARLREHATAEENVPFRFTSTGEAIPSVQAADMRQAADALEAAEKALAEMTAQRNAAAALYLRTGSNS